jgi:4-hydroxy-L-threonine phosphate dehydrogenase PdxA
MSNTLPLLGLMLGDCTGIGPEQSAKILASRGMKDVARLLVIGDRRVLEMGAHDAGVKLDVRIVKRPEDADWNSPAVQMIDLANLDPASVKRGEISAESGRVTGETLKHLIGLALENRVDGIVFAPLNKAALHAGGWKYNDEHIMFARLTNHQGFHGEMNVLDNKWMSRVTSHVSLREALDQITPKRIDEALTLAHETMKGAGYANPRIAVAALNPHGGENGLFGREEIEIIVPAVVRGAERGISCKGPFPADTVFIKGFGDDFDGVLTMYHDQGQIATKLKGFNRGVTVSGGLKTVFTTPAHGTAFDIVGKGVATTGAFENAIRLGAKLAAARKVGMQASYATEKH